MDIEKAKEIHSSPFWESIVREIDEKKISSLVNKLKYCSSEELNEIQIRIKVWEEVKRLPMDVVEREE